MPTSATNRIDDVACGDSESVLPLLLATGSTPTLGYFMGRISYRRDVREAIRRIEESPEPIEVSIRTL